MTGNGNILLRVEHLTMRFGGLVAVDDLSFEARQGNITALIGPNGAGKTTVFNCITGFYKPSEGRIGFRHGDSSIWDELETLTDSGKRRLARAHGTRSTSSSACRNFSSPSRRAWRAPSRTSGCFPA